MTLLSADEAKFLARAVALSRTHMHQGAGGPFGAVIVREQNRIVAAFRSAGATDRARATTMAALGVHEGMAFRILRRHDILREAGEQRLYLDEPVWEAHRVKRRRFALGIIGATLLAVTVVLLWAASR